MAIGHVIHLGTPQPIALLTLLLGVAAALLTLYLASRLA